MPSAGATVTLLAVAALLGGCRRGEATRAPVPPAVAAPSTSAPAAAPTSGSTAAALPAPPSPWRPSVDCDKLLGAERASKVLGTPLRRDDKGTLPSECRYVPAPAAAPAAANSPGAASAVVEVLFACREAAAPIARSVLGRIEAGSPAADVGQQGVLLDGEGGRGVVQFLDRGSPCAVQVTTLPADKALAMAREVASTIAAVRVAP